MARPAPRCATQPHVRLGRWQRSGLHHWAGGEPNDCGVCIGDPDGEQYTHTYTNGTWNDLGNFHGYAGPKFGVVEIAERTSVPTPAMISLMGAGVLLGGLLRRRAKHVC